MGGKGDDEEAGEGTEERKVPKKAAILLVYLGLALSLSSLDYRRRHLCTTTPPDTSVRHLSAHCQRPLRLSSPSCLLAREKADYRHLGNEWLRHARSDNTELLAASRARGARH